MIARKKYVGPEVDIWSLGVILFVMVTGCLPFNEKNMSKLFMSIMMGKYQIPDYVSQDCSSLIKSILKPQAKERCSLEFIQHHSWINMGDRPILGFLDNSDRIMRISGEQLTALKNYGFSDSEIEEYLQTGIPGPVKATLFLYKESRVPRSSIDIEEKRLSSIKDSNGRTSFTASSPVPVKKNSLISKIRNDINEPANWKSLDSVKQDSMHTIVNHTFDQHELQMIILQNLLIQGGRIYQFDEYQPSTLYGAVKLRPPELFQQSYDDDQELSACLAEVQQFELKFSATTISQSSGNYQTKFELLEYPSSNDLKSLNFDEFVIQVLLNEDFHSLLEDAESNSESDESGFQSDESTNRPEHSTL
jgi:serine/threonine protein kinase